MKVAPFSKTGGLGDVCGSLPLALAARGHRVMVVAPRYREYPEALDTQVLQQLLWLLLQQRLYLILDQSCFV